MLGFAYYETGNNQKALEQMNYFLEHRDTAQLLAQDFLYLGKIQKGMGQDSLAGVNYLLAFQMDSTLAGDIKIIADTLFEQKKYAEAGKFYFAIGVIVFADALFYVVYKIFFNSFFVRINASDAVFFGILIIYFH